MAEAAVLTVPSSDSIEFDIESLDLEEIFTYLDQKTKAKQLERNARGKSPGLSQTPRLLEPDNPLLLRFQKALKIHLESQIATLKGEVFELDAGIKKYNVDIEKRGVEAYNAQQIVSKQQTLLEQSEAELAKETANREEEELRLRDIEKKHKEESNKLAQANKEELQIRNEVEVSNDLLHQFSKWEEDIENQLKINQKISEKSRKENMQLANEKRKQDMRIHKLQSEVWRLESELETMAMQLRIKEEERERLAEAVASSNINLEASESELRCLVHGWQSVITAIQFRDKDIIIRRNELTQVHEKILSGISEIQTIKKLAAKEMNRNETLTMFKMRVETDLKNCINQINAENNKKNNYEKSISKMQTMIEHIEEDIKQVTLENAGKTRTFNTLTHEFEGLMRKKNDLDQMIILQLSEKVTNDKASKYLAKLVSQAKDTNAKKERTFAESENRNAQVLMEIESQKYANESSLRTKKELEADLSKMDKEVLDYMAVTKHCIAMSWKHLRNIEVLQKRLEEASKRTGEVSSSPYELKIKQLELSIDDVMQTISELQKFWMSEQSHVIHLCQKRQNQMRDTNILKKQILILDQKNLKVEDDIDDFQKKEAAINRNILALQIKLELFQTALDKKKQSRDGLDKDNFIKSREFELNLGDLELEAIELENSLAEHEEEKTLLAKELIDKNREVLEWEKKLKMVLETKKSIKEEKSDQGDVGKMKLEIHKMEVRYSQLKRAADQMIADLEHCVSRRDGIITNALARERRATGGTQNTKFHHSKSLMQIRNKIKQIKTQLDAANEKDAAHNVRLEELEKELDSLKEEVGKLEKELANLREDLELSETNKQFKFEILVSRQNILKVFSELGKGRTPFTRFKTEESQNNANSKQKEVNGKLLIVVGQLLTDFPVHVHILNRLNNSLKVPNLYACV